MTVDGVKANISYNSDVTTRLTVKAKPIAINKNAIEIVKRGEVVGTVDVTYDFSKVPAKYQYLVFSMIQKGTRINVCA